MPDAWVLQQWTVASSSKPDTTYTVTLTLEGQRTCTCPDFTFRKTKKGQPCKHLVALQDEISRVALERPLRTWGPVPANANTPHRMELWPDGRFGCSVCGGDTGWAIVQRGRARCRYMNQSMLIELHQAILTANIPDPLSGTIDLAMKSKEPSTRLQTPPLRTWGPLPGNAKTPHALDLWPDGRFTCSACGVQDGWEIVTQGRALCRAMNTAIIGELYLTLINSNVPRPKSVGDPITIPSRLVQQAQESRPRTSPRATPQSRQVSAPPAESVVDPAVLFTPPKRKLRLPEDD